MADRKRRSSTLKNLRSELTSGKLIVLPLGPPRKTATDARTVLTVKGPLRRQKLAPWPAPRRSGSTYIVKAAPAESTLANFL